MAGGKPHNDTEETKKDIGYVYPLDYKAFIDL